MGNIALWPTNIRTDITKAFDCVNWKFLNNIFPGHWRPRQSSFLSSSASETLDSVMRHTAFNFSD